MFSTLQMLLKYALLLNIVSNFEVIVTHSFAGK